MRLLVFALLVLTASGCVSTRFNVNVDGYASRNALAIPDGAQLHVMPNPNASNPLLDEEVRAKVEVLLEEREFKIVSFDVAEYIVMATYAIGDPRQVSVVNPVWVPGTTTTVSTPAQGTVATATTTGRVGYVRGTANVNDRYLTIAAVHKERIQDWSPDDGAVPWSWFCQTFSSGSSSDLRKVLDYMLVPTIEQFGRNTGGRVQVTLQENDRRVLRLRERFSQPQDDRR